MSTILDLNNAYLHDGHKLVIRIEVSVCCVHALFLLLKVTLC